MKTLYKWVLLLSALCTIFVAVITAVTFFRKQEQKQPKIFYWLVPFDSSPKFHLEGKTVAFRGVELFNGGNASTEEITITLEVKNPSISVLDCAVTGVIEKTVLCENPPVVRISRVHPQQKILFSVLFDDDPGNVTPQIKMKDGLEKSHLFMRKITHLKNQ